MTECEHAEAGMCGLCARALKGQAASLQEVNMQLAQDAVALAKNNDALKAEVNKLIAAVGEHVTVRSELRGEVAALKARTEGLMDDLQQSAIDNQHARRLVAKARLERDSVFAKLEEAEKNLERSKNWAEILALEERLSAYTAPFAEGEVEEAVAWSERSMYARISDPHKTAISLSALGAALLQTRAALAEVVALSDRKHDAWDRAKALLPAHDKPEVKK